MFSFARYVFLLCSLASVSQTVLLLENSIYRQYMQNTLQPCDDRCDFTKAGVWMACEKDSDSHGCLRCRVKYTAAFAAANTYRSADYNRYNLEQTVMTEEGTAAGIIEMLAPYLKMRECDAIFAPNTPERYALICKNPGNLEECYYECAVGLRNAEDFLLNATSRAVTTGNYGNAGCTAAPMTCAASCEKTSHSAGCVKCRRGAIEGQQTIRSAWGTYMEASVRNYWRVEWRPSTFAYWYITYQRGNVTLRSSRPEGTYLRAAKSDGGVSRTQWADAWEQWAAQRNTDGTWSFKSAHGKWLRAHFDGGIDTSEQCDFSTRFTVANW